MHRRANSPQCIYRRKRKPQITYGQENRPNEILTPEIEKNYKIHTIWGAKATTSEQRAETIIYPDGAYLLIYDTNLHTAITNAKRYQILSETRQLTIQWEKKNYCQGTVKFHRKLPTTIGPNYTKK